MRRTTLGIMAAAAAALAGGVLAGGGPVVAQEKKLTLFTWNLPIYEEKFRGWIQDFKELHPDFTVEWLDKKGTEWPTFYQTQVVAGTPPDILDIQGALWVEYADAGQLLDLTPYLEKEPDVRAEYNPDALKFWEYEGKQYMLPWYFSKSLLIYNKKLFEEAGLDGPPEDLDQLLDAAQRIAESGEGRTGFITLNFDWLYWPIFASQGIELLNEDMTEAAFNTLETVELVRKLAEATRSGAISNVSWTGRWVEPNNAFATGDIGMYQAHGAALFWVASNAEWVSDDTVGVVPFPRGWGTPNGHGLGISSATEHPDAAWDFIKIATNDKWQTVMADTFTILTVNESVDEDLIGGLRADEPLKAETLELSLANMDKATGNWVTPKDAAIKEAFWPEIQAALLGQKDPEEAVAAAESKVNRVLRRR